MIFLWLLIKHNNLSDPSYSTKPFNSFIQKETILSCQCENAPFIDHEHGHILTGDLPIVHNNKLRKLITKGAKCRELTTICWDKTNSLVIYGMNGTVEQLYNKLDKSILNNSFMNGKIQF